MDPSPRLGSASAPTAVPAPAHRRSNPVISRTEPGVPIVVLSNREPYAHERQPDGTVVVRRPAGGLVTGIEPLLLTRGGRWIAHGSGSADPAVGSPDGTLAVPPHAPRYELKRIFLSDAEVKGYYEGFANEALWPLCHRVHQRPVFRQRDWAAYRAVNARFAVAAREAARAGSPILVQDYHLALVPRLLRDAASAARISIFWHIPWPDAETFEICPQRRELLDGLLGADVLGFHTDAYGEKFMESVARLLPHAQVDRSRGSVLFRGHRTAIRTYPISVEWPYPAASRADGARLRRELGLDDALHVAIAVDRADYTKGLLERVRAVEVLLESAAALRGRYSLVQVAAPSRQTLARYRQVLANLEREVARVNRLFGDASWQPIVLRTESLAPAEIRRHYAMANSAVVTPLHDGMNLVAKEYVASCADEDGVLVLSRFAGAAVELGDALVVNPYDAREVAAAMARSAAMPAAERKLRMRAMRGALARNSIDHWAAALLADVPARPAPSGSASSRLAVGEA